MKFTWNYAYDCLAAVFVASTFDDLMSFTLQLAHLILFSHNYTFNIYFSLFSQLFSSLFHALFLFSQLSNRNSNPNISREFRPLSKLQFLFSTRKNPIKTIKNNQQFELLWLNRKEWNNKMYNSHWAMHLSH